MALNPYFQLDFEVISSVPASGIKRETSRVNGLIMRSGGYAGTRMEEKTVTAR
jgi:hypothetical protein